MAKKKPPMETQLEALQQFGAKRGEPLRPFRQGLRGSFDNRPLHCVLDRLTCFRFHCASE